ncbi:MAG TPA: adenylate/guanylate cyclase domain-containing protein [Acidimicrobiales bacterium]
MSADISGFTKLSEELAALGRQGAEELTDLLNACFTEMIDCCDGAGGDVLKFGGDALLVLFRGAAHTSRAASASWAMRRVIRAPRSTRDGRRVNLSMSVGIHSGEFELFLVEAGHRELLVTGPGATTTVDCESAAEAGQILLSPGAAEQVEERWLGEPVEHGRILRRTPSLEVTRWPSSNRVAIDLRDFVPVAQRAQIDAGVDGEHRRATVAFVEFSGTDELCRTLGPDEVGARLQALAVAVADAAVTFGVHWLGSDVYHDGGKIILTAGVPQSLGDNDERMLRAVRAILDAGVPLTLRSGINQGPLFAGYLGAPGRRTFTVMGDTVNLAARLMQKAEPGELIASRAVLDNSTAPFALEDLEPFFVKGKSVAIHAARVGALGREPTAQHRTAEMTPFVGRGAELDAAIDHIRRRAGRGSLVEVVGEPGIGKTRLVQALIDRLDERSVLETWCQQYDVSTPYAAARVLLRAAAGIPAEAGAEDAGRMLRDWLAAAAPAQLPWLPLVAIPFGAAVPPTVEADAVEEAYRRDRMHLAVSHVLEAALDTRAIVRIEDGQWMDEASSALLDAVMTNIDELPWVVLLTRWADAVVVQPPAATTCTLELDALERQDAVALAAHAVGDDVAAAVAAKIADRAGGHPLFVLELTRAVRAGQSLDDLPDTVDTALTARIDTLDPIDRVLLRDLAVVGVTARRDVVALAITEDAGDPQRWLPLEEFVTVVGPELRFRHNLVRQVAYEGLSYRRRRAQHQRVASAIETLAGAAVNEVASQLSLHCHRGEIRDRSWTFSRTAGDRARAAYANDEAVELYGRALEAARYLPEVPAVDVATTAEALADAAELAAHYEVARDALRTARRHAPSEAAPRLLRKQGLLHERSGEYTQALRWYGRALRLLEVGDDDDRAALEQRGQLQRAYAGVRYRQGRFRNAAAIAGEAGALARHIGDRRLEGYALYLGALARAELGEDTTAEALHALELLQEMDDLVGQANVLNNLGVAAYYRGDWDSAFDLYRRAEVARLRAGDVAGGAMQTNNIGEILSDQGRFDEADSCFRDALRSWRAARYLVGIALATSNLGRLAARRGRGNEALARLVEARAGFESIGATPFVYETDLRLIEARLVTDDIDGAIKLCASCAFLLEAPDVPEELRTWLRRLDAVTLIRAGDAATALGEAEDAVTRAEKIGAAYDLALALDVLATAYDGLGRASNETRARSHELLAGLGVALPDPSALSCLPRAASYGVCEP